MEFGGIHLITISKKVLKISVHKTSLKITFRTAAASILFISFNIISAALAIIPICDLYTASEASIMTSSMWAFSALLAICAGNSPVSGEFSAQRPVARSIDVFFDLRLNERSSKHSWGWWLETPSSPWWRHSNVFENMCKPNWPNKNLWYNTTKQRKKVLISYDVKLLLI